MKKILVLIISLFTFTCGVNAATEVVFEKCVDGDTAYFTLNGESTKFRFLAVDTPESVHPTKGEESYGKSASEYTCELLTNAKEIVIEYDEKSDKTDKYNRHLAWIWLDGKLLQKTLIENGYAQVAYIYGDYKYINNLCAIQKVAKSEKINIWSQKDYEEGYCSTVDVSDVSTEITMNMEVEEIKNDNTEIIIIIVIVIVCVLFTLITGKKVNIKKILKNLSIIK